MSYDAGDIHRTVPVPPGHGAIGVITPMVGGFYFGAIIGGAVRAAASAGHRVVAEQTFPARPGRERYPGEPVPGGPWSLDTLDGAVMVTRAMSAYRLDRVLAWGRPVVLVGADEAEGRVPIVLSDNDGGARAAVGHLLEHGHTRIGFVGDLSQRDIRERYEGYRDALLTHDIEPHKEWFFETAGNHEPGGEEAAARFVATGMPTTATVAATDRNALGFVQALRAHGLAVPRDLAVIGFDHTDSGARTIPRLTTVDPHHDRVGELAADLVLDLLQGDEVEATLYRVPTTVTVRESCGCSLWSAPSTPDADAGSAGRSLLRSIARTGFAGPTMGSRSAHDQMREGWVRAVVEVLEIAAERASAPSAAALSRLHDLTAALRPYPEALERCLAAVREVELELSVSLDPGTLRAATLHRASTEVLLALSRGCSRPALTRTGYLERIIDDQYEVDLHLMSTRGGPRMLTWLPGNGQVIACLGLWTGPESDGRREIEVVGVRGRSGALGRLVGQRMPATEFPPSAVTRIEPPGAAVVTFVLPVTSPHNDWGLLAINGRVESRTTSSRERFHQWAALLGAALDQEAVLERLRANERELRETASSERGLAERLRVLEERYAFWVQAARHGTWDWDVSAGSVYYSPQWKTALGYREDEIGSSPTEWLGRVHPDDVQTVSAQIAAQLGGAHTPLEGEHRMRTASGGYRWMTYRAVTVLDDTGSPSRLVGAHIDTTERKEAELALTRGVLRDPETRLATRPLLLDRLSVALERCTDAEAALVEVRVLPPPDGAGGPDPLVVAKTVELLRQAAPDGAARLGRDDFAVLLEGPADVGPRTAALVARLRALGEAIAVGVLESIAGHDAAAVLGAADIRLQRDVADHGRHHQRHDERRHERPTGGSREAWPPLEVPIRTS